MTCAFDSNGKFSLVASANSRDTTRQNFAAFREILFEFRNVFVVDCFNLFYAKVANLAACRLSDRLFNGTTYERLAEKYGLSTQQVKTIVYKAMDRLEKHL